MKFPTHITHIPWRRFFENYYILFFGILFIGIIVFSSALFILSTKKQDAPLDALNQEEAFSESIIFNINKLLNLREEYFNKLRTAKPTIKNPF